MIVSAPLLPGGGPGRFPVPILPLSELTLLTVDRSSGDQAAAARPHFCMRRSRSPLTLQTGVASGGFPSSPEANYRGKSYLMRLAVGGTEIRQYRRNTTQKCTIAKVYRAVVP